MVLVKTPSPKRDNSKLSNQTRKSRGSSPSDKSSRGSSPGKSTKSTGASSRIKSKLNTSHSSESGSIERLTEGDRTIIASKHLLTEDNINVVIRVRPLSNRESKLGDDSSIKLPGDGQILIENPINSGGDKKVKTFSYNVVFEPAATQEDILQYSGIKKLIEMAVEGFNCTCFCYGQTGSGKTHTLTGPPGLFDGPTNSFSEDHGLVFRSFVYLFKILQERQEFNFVLKSSFLEIYNEKIIDLLNSGSSKKSLAVRWSKKIRGFFVENLFTIECQELDDLFSVLEEGMRNRSVGTHNMNEHSSRSHTILTVHITSEQQMDNGVFITKQGKINFVDLAGSEMTKKTQSEGKTLEEANNINKSLMVLGYCIASLSDGKKKSGHIPYRDSNLTKLLADSLAGNGVTLMIACVSPARSNASETLNTLRYAARAKKIRTKPIIVMDPREELILSLKREVNALQSENDHLRSALHIGMEPANLHLHQEPLKDAKFQQLNLLKSIDDIDIDQLAELDNPDLSKLLRAYINENEALRRENAELYSTRDNIFRDQELVCRENERLLKKLEDVNSVCCRSPIIPARPTYSAEVLGNFQDDDLHSELPNIWTNPNEDPGSKNGAFSKIVRNNVMMPQKVLRELDKRIVGSFSNIAEAYKDKSHHRRYKSLDNGHVVSDNNGEHNPSPTEVSQMKKSTLRRTSTVPEEISSPKLANVFGPIVRQNSQQSLDGTPDSLLSSSFHEGQLSSAPDTGESSVTFTTPFPPLSRTASPFTPIDSSDKTINRKSRIDNIDRVFGSPVLHSQ